MSNRATITAEFDFRGVSYAPTLDVDFDELLPRSGGEFPCLHTVLAEANDIGLYSYEFEVMLLDPLLFSNAEGSIVDFIDDGGHLDEEGFMARWQQEQLDQQLSQLAGEHGLALTPNLLAALRGAYKLGRNTHPVR